MITICPTITAFSAAEYAHQINQVKGFAKRIHIDLMDGIFAPTKSPDLKNVWWPPELEVDIHLMYQDPMSVLPELIRHKPRMVIIHNEAQVHHMLFAAELHKADIEVGLAILQDTPVEHMHQVMHSFDQILVFSGNLGHHGGTADMNLLHKVSYVQRHYPGVEIAWDGGINDENCLELAKAGVSVLNVGGYIQGATDPAAAYAKLSEELKDVTT